MAGSHDHYALSELLVSLFDASELRWFAQEHLGPAVNYGLPGEGVSLTELAYRIVDILRRHGEINESLRLALLHDRPGRAREIEKALYRAGFSSRTAGFSSPSAATRPIVFFSYHRADAEIVRRLEERLQAHGIETFVDQSSIAVGEHILEQITRTLRESVAFVVLLTARSIESKWVETELNAALSYGIPLLPIVCGIPDDLVPALVRGYRWIRFDSMGELPEVARTIARSIKLRSKTRRDSDEDPELTALLVRFMTEAGRKLTTESRGLGVPEPIHIQRTNITTPLDVRMLAERVESNNCGYLVHRDEFASSVQDALLDAAMDSKTLVPLSERQMQAALADSRPQMILDELTTRARGSINLFEASNSIQAEWEFFGRSGLLQGIGDALGRGHHIYLTGTRKAGKTSFINLLRVRMATRPCIHIDLQAYGGEWTAAFFADIVAGFDRWAATRYRGKWTIEPPGALDRLSFVRTMRERHAIARGLGLRDRMLVLLDELERIVPRRDDRNEAERFVDAALGLRALGQGADACLSLFVADLRPEANRINLFGGGASNPFFEFFREMKLPNFSADEVDEMVQSLARRMGVPAIDTDFTQALYGLSGGHARLSRMLAAAAWDERTDRQQLVAADLKRGVEALADRDQPSRFFDENFWRPLLPAERVVLLAAAQEKRLDHPTDGLTPGTWSAARGSLRDQSLLVGEKVPAESFRAWLLAEKLPAGVL